MVVYVIFIVILVVWGIVRCLLDIYRINYFAHISQVKDNCDKRAYGTYNQFVQQFEKRKNDWELKYENSFFIHDKSFSCKSKCHAGIYCFDGVGMIMKTVEDFKKSQKFLKNEAKMSKNKLVNLDESFWDEN